jgi:hypothetical protein
MARTMPTSRVFPFRMRIASRSEEIEREVDQLLRTEAIINMIQKWDLPWTEDPLRKVRRSVGKLRIRGRLHGTDTGNQHLRVKARNELTRASP